MPIIVLLRPETLACNCFEVRLNKKTCGHQQKLWTLLVIYRIAYLKVTFFLLEKPSYMRRKATHNFHVCLFVSFIYYFCFSFWSSPGNAQGLLMTVLKRPYEIEPRLVYTWQAPYPRYYHYSSSSGFFNISFFSNCGSYSFP